MMKKILIAAASAGLIATGALALATPASAATSVSISIRSPHFSFSISNRPVVVHPKPYLVCKPIYKKIYYKARGKTYSKLVKVGQTCYWVHPRPTYTKYPHYGW
jgi:hypothetical protein